jgi:WhiB family redox-sensing transcriptional regulator
VVALVAERPDWMADANCRGMDTNLWYPEPGDDYSVAHRICAACIVQAECLDWADGSNPTIERHGIWGGLGERRRRYRRTRANRVAKRLAQV